MRSSNSATRSGQLAKALEQARDHVAAAESLVRTAKDAKRSARQKKRLAKEELRSAKKHFKQARAKLAEANEHLADAEKKMAKEVKRAPKSSKHVKGRSTARSSSRSHKARPSTPSPVTKVKVSERQPAKEQTEPPLPPSTVTEDGSAAVASTPASAE
jgi:Na+/phosphate symporter